MPRFHTAKFTFVFLGVILFSFFMPGKGKAASVQLEWRIILASHRKGTVDPRLRDIYRDLGAVFNYNSYKILDMNRVQLSKNQSVSIPLDRNRVCVIKVTNTTPKWVNVQIQINRKGRSVFGTAARLRNGRSLLIGGPSTRNKALIFSLRSFW